MTNSTWRAICKNATHSTDFTDYKNIPKSVKSVESVVFLFLLRFGYCGVAAPHPLVKSTMQRRDIRITAGEQDSRQTGARGFVWSSAVKNNFPFSWE